ncbi:ribonuclease H-like domain-containing protein [Ralstonia pseudosolanacearum]|uniref:Putative DNA polymerase / exonucleases n=1 Tax=Ralstonia solanacearum TaxID=305 RepID=A0A0S4TXD0_RALSL|nr:RNase H superfamily protein [Ralstonia solanacearum]CUV14670.1 putative DNA polymerase / exonucleases [Ralstonia solanacearum]
MTKARTLLLDIETAPILANVWRTWKENVGMDQIRADWYILSFSAKWLGAKRVMYFDQSKAKDIEDDTFLMRKLHELLNEADIVVAHNGRRFDLKKINARLIVKGFPPPSPYVIVDTLEIAKRHFAFTSNRLAYLTDTLCTEKKLAHAKFPGFMLWKECLAGNKEAWREMRTYNIQDVVSLEELYLKLRPWAEGHPNVANFDEPEHPACPKCGSENVIQKGHRHTQVGRYVRYRCNDCGGWARGRVIQNSKAQRSNLLIN